MLGPVKRSIASGAWRTLACLLALALFSTAGMGCRRSQPVRRAVPINPPPQERLSYLHQLPVGASFTDHPWVAHVKAVDLDRDGRLDVLVADCKEGTVSWIRQTAPGTFDEIVLANNLPAPVRAEEADLTGDGHLDIMVSCMGFVFPNNDRIGSIVILENDGRQNFTRRVIIENIARVTDVRAADFNRDGQVDLAVGQFGYDQGEIRWMERTGPWEFKSHILLELAGAINVLVADFTGDGNQDMAALISQQWEEIHFFEGDGRGNFTSKVIFGSTNEDYGSSGLSMSDLNGDGRMDILYTNGDGFGPAALPGPRPWHGVQWLENRGGGYFRYHRIGDLPGAYSPVGVDLDSDGRMDVVAGSAYADWDKKDPRVVSLMWFRSEGQGRFSRHVLAYAPKDLITVDAGDFDGTGRPSIVTGGFYVYPPYERMSRVSIWRRTGAP